MLALVPAWVAPVITVAVFIVTTAAGFFLMRVAFNMRPAFGPRRPAAGPPADAVDPAAAPAEEAGRR